MTLDSVSEFVVASTITEVLYTLSPSSWLTLYSVSEFVVAVTKYQQLPNYLGQPELIIYWNNTPFLGV